MHISEVNFSSLRCVIGGVRYITHIKHNKERRQTYILNLIMPEMVIWKTKLVTEDAEPSGRSSTLTSMKSLWIASATARHAIGAMLLWKIATCVPLPDCEPFPVKDTSAFVLPIITII